MCHHAEKVIRDSLKSILVFKMKYDTISTMAYRSICDCLQSVESFLWKVATHSLDASEEENVFRERKARRCILRCLSKKQTEGFLIIRQKPSTAEILSSSRKLHLWTISLSKLSNHFIPVYLDMRPYR